MRRPVDRELFEQLVDTVHRKDVLIDGAVVAQTGLDVGTGNTIGRADAATADARRSY